MSQKTARIQLPILIFLILILLTFNFIYFRDKGSREIPQYLKGDEVFCPLLSPSPCEKAVEIPSVLGKEYCFTAKKGTKIISPIEGEVNYGQVSFGEKIGEGDFFPRLLIKGQDKEVSLIFSSVPKEKLRYVEAGEEVGIISKGKIREKGYDCNLILLLK